jgi:four helix bundle protein
MATAKTFRDLEVWKIAFKAAQVIFSLSKGFPKEERYSLTDQVRRSSRAVTAMIAEAWGRRRYRAVFVNKLDEALGEANETQSWLAHALRCEYITAADFRSEANSAA